MERHVWVVQIPRFDGAAGNLVSIDEEACLVLSVPYDRCYVLPGILAENSWCGGDCSIGHSHRGDGFEAQDTLVVGHVEIPAVRHVVLAKADDAALFQLTRMDPGRNREFAIFDVQHVISFNDQRVAITIKLQRLAKWRIDEGRLAEKLALKRLVCRVALAIAVQWPSANQLILEFRSIRCSRRRLGTRKVHINLINTWMCEVNGLCSSRIFRR